MKIAITSTGKTLDSNVDPRFGRAAYFIIADTETEEFDAIENSNVQASGGAGINSAKVVIDAGAKVVIAGNFGPNAQRTLDAAGIKSYAGAKGTVAEAIELFKSGKLTQATEPNVQSHFGMDS
ncbi:MAG: NifB/NifX family molybdenum-iron cluster-binding protein [Planctomycetes bacterium]|nr:NifB/NifX family molybdenum-iron cluster-binding protein [Planctomycetota bacterium]